MCSHMVVSRVDVFDEDVLPHGCGICSQWMWDMSMLTSTFPMCGISLESMLGVWARQGRQGQASDPFPGAASPDRTELQRAMEHNSRLDKEILALRARVQTLDLERKAFLELVRIHAKPTILGWLSSLLPNLPCLPLSPPCSVPSLSRAAVWLCHGSWSSKIWEIGRMKLWELPSMQEEFE